MDGNDVLRSVLGSEDEGGGEGEGYGTGTLPLRAVTSEGVLDGLELGGPGGGWVGAVWYDLRVSIASTFCSEPYSCVPWAVVMYVL